MLTVSFSTSLPPSRTLYLSLRHALSLSLHHSLIFLHALSLLHCLMLSLCLSPSLYFSLVQSNPPSPSFMLTCLPPTFSISTSPSISLNTLYLSLSVMCSLSPSLPISLTPMRSVSHAVCPCPFVSLPKLTNGRATGRTAFPTLVPESQQQETQRHTTILYNVPLYGKNTQNKVTLICLLSLSH